MITINFLMHISIPIMIINLKAFKQIDEIHFKITPIQIFKFKFSTEGCGMREMKSDSPIKLYLCNR